jgi:hypothetical protein
VLKPPSDFGIDDWRQEGWASRERKASPMDDSELLYHLGVFEVRDDEGLRAARRPAGPDLIVEVTARQGHKVRYATLEGFWLAALWRFLEDSKQNPLAFEGLAFQASAQPLTIEEFNLAYEPIRERLTLPPPYRIELRKAFRVLHGRITSFAGVTRDGEFWAGFYQANVYEMLEC